MKYGLLFPPLRQKSTGFNPSVSALPGEAPVGLYGVPKDESSATTMTATQNRIMRLSHLGGVYMPPLTCI